MSEYFEYIDAYFQKQLNDSENKEFEQRCINDVEFANDVAFYVSTRAAISDVLLDQKKTEWSQLPIRQADEPTDSSVTPVRQINYKKWILYAAAACIVLAIIAYPLLSTDSPHELANKYIRQELTDIGQTMDAAKDSMQSAIAAFKKKDYQTAMQFFQQIYSRDTQNNDALRYLGQTYLVTDDYDKAIVSFEELSRKQSYSNPGLFLKAVTLMKRNEGNDQKEARIILQKIADDEDADGNKEAKKWLKNWPDE